MKDAIIGSLAFDRLITDNSILKAKIIGARLALKDKDIESALKWLKIDETDDQTS